MDTVRSSDGTTIVFDLIGDGPPVIVVAGALGSRSFDPLTPAALLAKQFTVISYDRRGRGDSGDTSPYAVDREVEDIAALVEAAGGSAFLYGISSGAVLALEAATQLPGVAKLAMYEPPFIVDDSHPARPADYVARIEQAVAAGRPGDAVAVFMGFLGLPEEAISAMRTEPYWPAMETVAHTLAYDAAVMGDTQSGKPLPRQRWASVTIPTLVLDGEKTEEPFLHVAVDVIADILPNVQRRTLPGQDHAVAPDALVPVLTDFFNK